MAVDKESLSFGEYLVREGVITQVQLNSACNAQRQNGHSIGRILVNNSLITEEIRLRVLTEAFGFDAVQAPKDGVDPLTLSTIPYQFAEKHRAVPFAQTPDHTLVVAMEDPSDLLVVDAIKNQVGLPVKPVATKIEDVEKILKQYQIQTHSDIEARQEARARNWRNNIVVRVIKYASFPVLSILPLVLFFVAISTNFMDFAEFLQAKQAEGSLEMWDRTLYLMLIWGTWVMILFELQGLIFGRSDEEEE